MAKIAIIETGGKQYVVTKGTILDVETIKGADKPGGEIKFDKVLLIDDGSKTEVGAPYIKGAEVSGELVENFKDKKVVVLRYRQKSRYYKKKGHRQQKSSVRITDL